MVLLGSGGSKTPVAAEAVEDSCGRMVVVMWEAEHLRCDGGLCARVGTSVLCVSVALSYMLKGWRAKRRHLSLAKGPGKIINITV